MPCRPLCRGAQGSGEASLASPQPALGSRVTAEPRVPLSPGERLLYRREGAEMQRNDETVTESEPGRASKRIRRIGRSGAGSGGRWLRRGARTLLWDRRCYGWWPGPRVGPSILSWALCSYAGCYKLHVCVPPKSVCRNLFPRRDGVRRWEVIRSGAWRPHEWVRVLIKGPQRAPSPSTMGGHRKKTPSVNQGAQTCRPLDLGLPASKTMRNTFPSFLSYRVPSIFVTAA